MTYQNYNTIGLLSKESQPPPAYGRVIPPGQTYKFDGLTWRTIERSVFIVERCPFCRKQHRHAWPGNNQVMTRISHCAGNSRKKREESREEYCLVEWGQE